MRHLLSHYYDISVDTEILIDGNVGLKNDEWLYFTTLVEKMEAILMEQAVLAYHLNSKGYLQTALPIQNKEGKWITEYDENAYIVFRAMPQPKVKVYEYGEELAYFHENNMHYPYEPQNISSYGQWKQLWIDKLTLYENHIIEEARNKPNAYYSLLMDTLPYLIGVSENAIQYIQESEREDRYDHSDQATITFHRYTGNVMKAVIWPNEIVFDHPVRDVAEDIRTKLLQSENGLSEVESFIKQYESVRYLSVFSWRLLYARLLFPIHLFDFIGKGFTLENYDNYYEELLQLLQEQSKYESRLGDFFKNRSLNNKDFNIPVVHWM